MSGGSGAGQIAGALQAALPRLVLASGSPARRNLLAAAGLQFEAIPARIDEDAVKQSARIGAVLPDDTALLLAELKAMRISQRHPDALVIGADQLLVCEGEIFDKPADMAAARAQLRRLRGRWHELVGGAVCVRDRSRVWHYAARARLLMRDFSDVVLDGYLAAEGEHVCESVGAYRIEGIGLQLFDAIEGDYFSILGLPLVPLLGFLRQHGVLAR